MRATGAPLLRTTLQLALQRVEGGFDGLPGGLRILAALERLLEIAGGRGDIGQAEIGGRTPNRMRDGDGGLGGGRAQGLAQFLTLRDQHRGAFAQPALGSFGDLERNSIVGPAFWTIDLALSKLIAFGAAQNLEVRVEAFNLLNHFNWGLPATSLQQGTFGRITSQATDPRILQFGVKYAF